MSPTKQQQTSAGRNTTGLPVPAIAPLPDDSTSLPCPKALITQADIDEANRYLLRTAGSSMLSSGFNLFTNLLSWIQLTLGKLFSFAA